MSALKPVKAKGVVHKLVAQTAKEMAYEVYECTAKDNAFYKRYPNADAFVARRWQSFIQHARESLVSLLHPDNHFMSTEAMRQEIHEALLLNAAANPAANQIN